MISPWDVITIVFCSDDEVHAFEVTQDTIDEIEEKIKKIRECMNG